MVSTFEYSDNDDEELRNCYSKKCDLWSLGVMMYTLLSGNPLFVGHCGNDCGWDEGENCSFCQNQLVSSIQHGELKFSDPCWQSISMEAKDLLRMLLAKNETKRIQAYKVLDHPWIVGSRMKAGKTSAIEIPGRRKGLESCGTELLSKFFSVHNPTNKI